MKNIIGYKTLLILTLLVISGTTINGRVSANDFTGPEKQLANGHLQSGQYEYVPYGDGVDLINDSKEWGDQLPDTINGKNVVRVEQLRLSGAGNGDFILPEHLEEIGATASDDIFQQIWSEVNQINITIPASVTKIESNAFQGKSVTDQDVIREAGHVNIYLLNPHADIAENAFSTDSHLSVFYGKTTDSQGNTYGIKKDGTAELTVASLTTPKLIVPQYVQFQAKNVRVTSIGSVVENWRKPPKFTSVTLPDSVTEIKESAFRYSKLKAINLGKGVKKIGDDAFRSQDETKFSDAMTNHVNNLIIPNSVTSIGKGAFEYNYIDHLQVGNHVQQIGENAFNGNDLTSLILPDSLQSIGRRAFSDNLFRKVVVPNKKTKVDVRAFDGFTVKVYQGIRPKLALKPNNTVLKATRQGFGKTSLIKTASDPADGNNLKNKTNYVVLKRNGKAVKNAKINLKKEGTYQVKYTLTTSYLKSATVTITVKIKANKPSLKLKTKNIRIKHGVKLIPSKYVASSQDQVDGNLKSKVKVTGYNKNHYGKQRVNFIVTNSNHKTTKITATVTN